MNPDLIKRDNSVSKMETTWSLALKKHVRDGNKGIVFIDGGTQLDRAYFFTTVAHIEGISIYNNALLYRDWNRIAKAMGEDEASHIIINLNTLGKGIGPKSMSPIVEGLSKSINHRTLIIVFRDDSQVTSSGLITALKIVENEFVAD
jgi:hypothetical protein